MEYLQINPEIRYRQLKLPRWYWNAWLLAPWKINSICTEDFPRITWEDRLRVNTREGIFLVEWGDYIIRQDNGDLKFCKEKDFKK